MSYPGWLFYDHVIKQKYKSEYCVVMEVCIMELSVVKEEPIRKSEYDAVTHSNCV